MPSVPTSGERVRRTRKTAARTQPTNGAARLTDAQLDRLVKALEAARDGDFSVRLRVEGPLADVAAAFNALVERNQQFTKEIVRVSKVVGREGRINERASVAGAPGSWSQKLEAVNDLVDNMARPTIEFARVIDAVAGGDLTQRIPLEIAGQPVRGEFRRIGTTVNAMVDQLSSFADEVTRVAREVGTEGKLGGQAKVKGVSGTWNDLTDSVNQMASNLTGQVRNIKDVTTAVANGDLSRKVTVDVKGEVLELKNTVNTMVDQLSPFADEVTRVAREVGTDGKLGGQAQVKGASGVWKDLTENVNNLANNLTGQVRNIKDVTTAVANGDLSRKITVDVKGEVLELKETINTMVDQLRSFSSEVTRVAREVGTEGKLGGQAQVEGVSGVWKDLTENVNTLANNLTDQVRNIAEVTTAVANGDLSKKITVDVKGEVLELKETVNTMVDQLRAFAAEVTRVAREVGTEGKLGGQAQVEGVSGVWKDLTENVNNLANNLTGQVRNIAAVTTAVANGDLSQKITVDVKGEVLELKETINTMVDQLSAFAAEVTRVAREVGTEGKLGGQAEVRGRLRHVARPDREREHAREQPHRPGAEHRRGDDRGRQGRPLEEDHRRRARRGAPAQEHDQHDGRPALRVRGRGDARRARGRHRGQARRPGAGEGRLRRVARPDRERQPDGRQPDRPGAVDRRGDDRGRPRRPDAEDHDRDEGRDRPARLDDQHDGRPALLVRRRGDPRRPRGRHRGHPRRPGDGRGRLRHVARPDRQREPAREQPHEPGARDRRRDDRGRERRPLPEDHRRREG